MLKYLIVLVATMASGAQAKNACLEGCHKDYASDLVRLMCCMEEVCGIRGMCRLQNLVSEPAGSVIII